MEDSLELIENRVQRVSKSLKEMESFDNYPKFLGNNEELMTLLKTHLAPDIDDWILNIFQFGSRTYQCHRPDSDWDYLCVVRDDIPYKSLLNRRFDNPGKYYEFFVFEYPNCELRIISFTDMIRLLWEHHHDMLQMISLPPEFIVKNTIDFRQFFVLDKDVLRRTLNWEYHHRMGIANRKLRHGKELLGRKDIIHAIRYIRFGIQIVKHGKIIDFTECNAYLREMLAAPTADVDKWKLIIDESRQDFRVLSNYQHFYTSFETERAVMCNFNEILLLPKSSTTTAPLIASDFSHLSKQPNSEFSLSLSDIQNGILLQKNKHIRITQHSKYSNVFHLQANRMRKKEIEHTKQFWNGLVFAIDPKTKKFNTLAFSMHKLKLLNKSDVLTLIKQPNFETYEFIDGTQATLYWLQDHWEISSKWECEGIVPMSFKNIINKSLAEEPERVFKNRFWACFEAQKLKLPTDRSSCYVFQYVDPNQRYVVNYETPQLYLVNVFDLNAMAHNPNWKSIASEIGCLTPKLISNEMVSKSLDLTCPWLFKGFIFREKDTGIPYFSFRSDHYVASYYSISITSVYSPISLTCELCREQMNEIVRQVWPKTLLFHFPNHEKLANESRKHFNSMLKEVQKSWVKVNGNFDLHFVGSLFQNRAATLNVLVQMIRSQILNVENYFRTREMDTILKLQYRFEKEFEEAEIDPKIKRKLKKEAGKQKQIQRMEKSENENDEQNESEEE